MAIGDSLTETRPWIFKHNTPIEWSVKPVKVIKVVVRKKKTRYRKLEYWANLRKAPPRRRFPKRILYRKNKIIWETELKEKSEGKFADTLICSKERKRMVSS